MLLLACSLSAFAADKSAVLAPKLPAEDDPALNSTNTPPVREIAKGIYEIGKVRVDRNKRAVSFPVVLNAKEGPMEYLLVTTYGKVHESVFRTDVQPFHIHTAMLLLGVKLPKQAANPSAIYPSEPTHSPAAEILKGENVAIEFSWEEGGKKITRSAAEVLSTRTPVVNAEGEPTVKRNQRPKLQWVYNGSAFYENRFLAQIGGSVFSLITDASALVNHIAPGHENDDMWSAAPENLPSVETLVTATVRLSEPLKK